MPDLQGVYASYGQLTDQIASDLWAANYRVFSQQLWTGVQQPSFRVENLRVALNHGFVLVGPIALTSQHSGSDHVNSAYSGLPADIITALALTPIDVELPGISNDNVRQAVEQTVTFGKRRSLYFSVHTWVDYQGDPSGFVDCLAYVANYDGIDSTAFVAMPPSMKNAFLVGKQYTNTIDTMGLSTCREVWDSRILIPDLVPVPVPVPGDSAVNFLAKVAVNHESRIKTLEGKK